MSHSRVDAISADSAADLGGYFLTLDELSGPIDWTGFFGNDRPVELEIGTGRGLFLMNAGQQQPERNFLGIELDYQEGRFAARRLRKRELTNVRILGGNARAALDKFIPNHSVSVVHVYFPDPWWKRRHRTRRIFNAAFVAELARVLIPGGTLHAWTDVEEYFGVIQALVNGNANFQPQSPPAERPAAHDMDYHTNFERKKRKSGCPIYRGCWKSCQLSVVSCP